MTDRPRSAEPPARRVVVERLLIRFEGGGVSSAQGRIVARQAEDMIIAERSDAVGSNRELATRIASAVRQTLAEARRR